MQSEENGNVVVIRLFPDENIHKQIKKVCKAYNIETAIVLSGIGQLKDVDLGYFKEKGNYNPEKFKGPFELLSLNGNIIKQEEDYISHLHVVLGDSEKKVLGGHLIDGFTEVTNEIALLKTNIPAKRKIDEKTGLKSLFLE